MNNEKSAQTTQNEDANNQKGDSKIQDAKLGSGPAVEIPNGGSGEERQRKESTGTDTKMGGSGGGNAGMGNER